MQFQTHFRFIFQGPRMHRGALQQQHQHLQANAWLGVWLPPFLRRWFYLQVLLKTKTKRNDKTPGLRTKQLCCPRMNYSLDVFFFYFSPSFFSKPEGHKCVVPRGCMKQKKCTSPKGTSLLPEMLASHNVFFSCVIKCVIEDAKTAVFNHIKGLCTKWTPRMYIVVNSWKKSWIN